VFKVYRAVLRLLSPMEWRRLDQTKLGKLIGVPQGHVSRSLAHLVKLNAIEREGKGPLVKWRLTLYFKWRGDVPSYKAQLHARGLDEATGLPPDGQMIVAEDIDRKTATTPPRAGNNRATRLRLVTLHTPAPKPAE
jgi:hypothetical protein